MKIKSFGNYAKYLYYTNTGKNYRSVYEKQKKLTPLIGKYINDMISGKFASRSNYKKERAMQLLKHIAEKKLTRMVNSKFLREVAKNANYRPTYRKIRNAPKFFSKTHAAPKSKVPVPNINLKNVSNYMNLRRKILRSTNIPGTYTTRKKLLEKLDRNLENIKRENFISLENVVPSRNTHYVLKNGHPGTWLFLRPNSYHNLAMRIGRRGTFEHPTTRRIMHFGNFKLVKR